MDSATYQVIFFYIQNTDNKKKRTITRYIISDYLKITEKAILKNKTQKLHKLNTTNGGIKICSLT